MDALISRKAAVDAVEKESQVDGAYGYMDTKSIVDLLNDLPSAQPEQRWIPCSERLPESGVYVLISHVGYVTEDYLDIDELIGGVYFWNSGIDLNEELNNLAWMPLPAPWKGEADGQH